MLVTCLLLFSSWVLAFAKLQSTTRKIRLQRPRKTPVSRVYYRAKQCFCSESQTFHSRCRSVLLVTAVVSVCLLSRAFGWLLLSAHVPESLKRALFLFNEFWFFRTWKAISSLECPFRTQPGVEVSFYRLSVDIGCALACVSTCLWMVFHLEGMSLSPGSNLLCCSWIKMWNPLSFQSVQMSSNNISYQLPVL